MLRKGSWGSSLFQQSKKIVDDEPRSRDALSEHLEAILEANLFDAAFYLETNPDVDEAGVDPLRHFLEYGHTENRWPNPQFDTAFYRQSHMRQGDPGNPLVHYLRQGRAAGLETYETFNISPPKQARFDLPKPATENGIEDNDSFAAFCFATGLFDSEYYLATNRDCAEKILEDGKDPAKEAFEHYMNCGWQENRSPSRVFSTEWYRQTHLANDHTINPLRHYFDIGMHRGFSTTHGLSDLASLRRLSKTGLLQCPNDPVVTVVTINFNGRHHLQDLFASLERQTHRDLRVMMVDNGSTDGSVEWTKDRFPNVDVIALSENIGFADACNLAQDHARTQLVAYVNNDMVCGPDWLKELVAGLKASPQRAAVTSKMLFFKEFITVSISSAEPFQLDTKDLLHQFDYHKFFLETGRIGHGTISSDEDHRLSVKLPLEIGKEIEISPVFDSQTTKSGLAVTYSVSVNGVQDQETKGTAKVQLTESRFGQSGRWVINNAGSHETSDDIVGDRGFAQYDVGQFNVPQDVPYLCGGSFLLNRVALKGRPVFIGDLFAYYEDTELSLRLRQEGYTIGYAPDSIAYHKHASTSQENSAFFRQRVERNYSAFLARKRGNHCLMTQIQAKKHQLNHLAKFHKTQESPTENDQQLSVLLPKVMTELDHLGEAFRDGQEFNGSHRSLRIGVYNSYWRTGGGGELHALNVALELTAYGVVDLISEQDFSLQELLARFQLPADRFRKVIVSDFCSENTRNYDVFVNSTYGSNIVSRAEHSFFIVSFPHENMPKDAIESYVFLSNSKFTDRWCNTYWGNRKSHVLYPLVQRFSSTGRLKDSGKIILNVGRYFADGHSKMQDECVRTYRQMVDQHPQFADWKLMCVGGLLRDDPADLAYFEETKAMADGYNIELITDAAFENLNEIFKTASIYWHATGFGKDVDQVPDQFEHFGISVVEAASAGCIPIVLDAAGPAEIVQSASIGGGFATRQEWIRETVKWISLYEQDPKGFAKARQAAATGATRFGAGPFRKQAAKVFAGVRSADQALPRLRDHEEFQSETYWRHEP